MWKSLGFMYAIIDIETTGGSARMVEDAPRFYEIAKTIVE